MALQILCKAPNVAQNFDPIPKFRCVSTLFLFVQKARHMLKKSAKWFSGGSSSRVVKNAPVNEPLDRMRAMFQDHRKQMTALLKSLNKYEKAINATTEAAMNVSDVMLQMASAVEVTESDVSSTSSSFLVNVSANQLKVSRRSNARSDFEAKMTCLQDEVYGIVEQLNDIKKNVVDKYDFAVADMEQKRKQFEKSTEQNPRHHLFEDRYEEAKTAYTLAQINVSTALLSVSEVKDSQIEGICAMFIALQTTYHKRSLEAYLAKDSTPAVVPTRTLSAKPEPSDTANDSAWTSVKPSKEQTQTTLISEKKAPTTSKEKTLPKAPVETKKPVAPAKPKKAFGVVPVRAKKSPPPVPSRTTKNLPPPPLPSRSKQKSDDPSLTSPKEDKKVTFATPFDLPSGKEESQNLNDTALLEDILEVFSEIPDAKIAPDEDFDIC